MEIEIIRQPEHCHNFAATSDTESDHVDWDPEKLMILVKCSSRSSFRPAQPMCDVRRIAPSPPPFCAAWRFEAPFSTVSRFDRLYTLRYLWHAAQSYMVLRFIPRRILDVIVDAPMVTSLASALLPCDFSRAYLHWCRKISQRRISTWFAARRSRSRSAHVYKWGPCPWIGQEIRLQDSITRSRWRQNTLQALPHVL